MTKAKSLEEVVRNGHSESPPEKVERIQISPLKMRTVELSIKGTSPYCQARFSTKAQNQIRATQEAGSQAKSKKKRDARNFEDDWKNALYRLPDSKYGIPATAFRNAMISACRTVSFKMTLAKLSIFIEPDGFDEVDGVTPLVELSGTPIPWNKSILPARNTTGVIDLRCRPTWREWSAKVRIRFDEDQFSLTDIVNLLIRVGAQVGIGEGRPDSRNSAGVMQGLFSVEC